MFLAEPLRVDLLHHVGNTDLGKHVFGVLINDFFAVLVHQTIGIEGQSRGFDLRSILFSLPLLAFPCIRFLKILLKFLGASFVLGSSDCLLSLQNHRVLLLFDKHRTAQQHQESDNPNTRGGVSCLCYCPALVTRAPLLQGLA